MLQQVASRDANALVGLKPYTCCCLGHHAPKLLAMTTTNFPSPHVELCSHLLQQLPLPS